MPDAWSLVAILAKWALYVGVLGASGTVFCAAVFQLKEVRLLALGFACLGLTAAVLAFMLIGVALTGDASGMTDPEMLGLLWDTRSGSALMRQLIGLGIVLAGLPFGTAGLILSAIGGLLALSSFAVVGHISDRDSPVLTLVLLAHLVGIAFWIGILTPLKRLAADQARVTEAAALGHQFGRLAALVVPTLILAGAVMTYTLVGSPVAMIATSYGQALLLKVLFVAVLLGLAAANKLRFVPDLEKGDTASAKHLARSISLEWSAVLLILAVTAAFTSTLTPPT